MEEVEDEWFHRHGESGKQVFHIVFKSLVQSSFFAFFGAAGPQLVLKISQNPATGNWTHLDWSRTVFEWLQLVQDQSFERLVCSLVVCESLA